MGALSHNPNTSFVPRWDVLLSCCKNKRRSFQLFRYIIYENKSTGNSIAYFRQNNVFSSTLAWTTTHVCISLCCVVVVAVVISNNTTYITNVKSTKIMDMFSSKVRRNSILTTSPTTNISSLHPDVYPVHYYILRFVVWLLTYNSHTLSP